jgi:superfamily I DNA/RNA helicase
MRGQWTTTDRDNNVYSINPFSQIRKNKYDLLNKIKSLPEWTQTWVNLGHAVAFPQAVVSHNTELPLDAPAELILDAHDMDRLPERLQQIMAYWRSQETVSIGSDGQSLIEALIKLLAPTTTLPNPLSIQIDDEQKEIFRLTAEQYRLLDFLNRTRRAAISGAAGSGKTMMAVEKAKRLAKEGFRVLLVCYNSPLAKHLKLACAEIVNEVGPDNFFAGTFHGWCAHVAQKSGISLPVRDGSPDWENYPEVLLQGIGVQPDLLMDAVIVDEGQDMEELWWVALTASLSNHRDSLFYVFYDDNQIVNLQNRAHSHTQIPDDLQLMEFHLMENVRNTRTIHKLASGFYNGGSSEPHGPSGRTVEMFDYTNEVGLQQRLSRLLHRLLVVEDISPEQIAILTPHSLIQSALPKILEALGTKQKQVSLSEISMFKGLERPVIILAELDEVFMALPDRKRDALSYVGTSRPRNHLSLIGHEAVLAYLRSKAIR